jgi:hypothetical protein
MHSTAPKAVICADLGHVKHLCAIFVVIAAAEIAAAQTVPLPRPRPVATMQQVDKAPPASACRLRLTPARAIAPSVDAIEGPGGCGDTDLVRLEAVVLADGSRVEMSPPAVLRCSMAEAVVDWVREDIVELAAFNLGSALRSIHNFAAYHCRSRNNIIGAAVSEHGKGNALDIRAVRLVNGKIIDPTDPHVSRDFREGWRRSVCSRFNTVLGPGSDGYHENHIHIDLMQRRTSGYKMCQWDVRMPETDPEAPALASANTVPLPPPRPKMAPTARRADR